MSKIHSSKSWSITSIVFGAFGVVALLLLIFYANITGFLTHNKVDIFKENLQMVALYTLPFDRDLSHFLVLFDNLLQSYEGGENILKTRTTDIERVWEYATKNRGHLTTVGFQNYTSFFKLLDNMREYKNEVFDLLGKNKPYNYLVILQNTNEKRPNGGFFGSFAFITVDQGHVTALEIVDAYYPDFVAYRTRIVAPEWTQAFLPDRKIGFIAGNKFGFTDIDGKNLKDLYEKMFNETYDQKKIDETMMPNLWPKLLHKNIKGVVFLRSDLIEKMMPQLSKTIQERQFLNASVDLMRGEVRGNKKERYIAEVKEFFNNNSTQLLKNIVNNFERISKEQFLNIYLSNISTGLQQAIVTNNLNNTFQTGKIYARDTNVSFDKVDAFVEKNIQILDSKNKIILEQSNDIITIPNLSTGDYTMHIKYTLNVPESYRQFMSLLEKKYNITLTEREKGILALQASTFKDPKYGEVQKWRESKSTMYFPKTFTIKNITGDTFYHEKFTTPFANGLFYQMGINQNMTSKEIVITFSL